MADNFKLFNPYTVDEQALLLAQHLPSGRLWDNKFNPTSDLYKLIRALGVEFYRFEVLLNNTMLEMDINKADKLLIDWEKSVGLPDDCFKTDNISIEERRNQVYQKFTKFGGVQTADDFIRVAAIFGINIEILTGGEIGFFPLQFPINFFSSATAATHTIIVRILDQDITSVFFPLPFPIPFSSGNVGFLQCIFDALAPANVLVKFADAPIIITESFISTESGDAILTESGDFILV